MVTLPADVLVVAIRESVYLPRIRLYRHAVLPKRLVEVIAKFTGGSWPVGFDELSIANHCLYDFVLRSRFWLVWLSESQSFNWSRFGVLDFANDRIKFVVEEISFRSA